MQLDSSWGYSRINTKRRAKSMTICMRCLTKLPRYNRILYTETSFYNTNLWFYWLYLIKSFASKCFTTTTALTFKVNICFLSSPGTAEQADSHRGFQWNNSDLWGGVWNSRTLQQGVHRHVSHIRQQYRNWQVCLLCQPHLMISKCHFVYFMMIFLIYFFLIMLSTS